MKRTYKEFDHYDGSVRLTNQDDQGRWIVYTLEYGDGDRFTIYGNSVKEVIEEWNETMRANRIIKSAKLCAQQPIVKCHHINEEAEEAFGEVLESSDDKKLLDNLVEEAEEGLNGAFEAFEWAMDWEDIQKYNWIKQAVAEIEETDKLSDAEQAFLDNDSPTRKEIDQAEEVFAAHI